MAARRLVVLVARPPLQLGLTLRGWLAFAPPPRPLWAVRGWKAEDVWAAAQACRSRALRRGVDSARGGCPQSLRPVGVGVVGEGGFSERVECVSVVVGGWVMSYSAVVKWWISRW
jgi:hypothetical protein